MAFMRPIPSFTWKPMTQRQPVWKEGVFSVGNEGTAGFWGTLMPYLKSANSMEKGQL